MEGMEGPGRGGVFFIFIFFIFAPANNPGRGEVGKGAEIMFIFQHNLLAVSICFDLHIQAGGGIFCYFDVQKKKFKICLLTLQFGRRPPPPLFF